LGHLGCVLWLSGHPAQARSCAEAALGWAEGVSHPPTVALALTLAAWVYVLRREHGRVDELASRALAVAGEYGLAFWTGIASIQRGWALAELGDAAEAAALLHGGLQSYCGIGAGTCEVAYRALAVEAYTHMGRQDDAVRELAVAFDAMERHGERYFEAELLRAKGELLEQRRRSSGPASPRGRTEAERCFRKAIGIARRQRIRSLELRAAISLSRLLRGRVRHAEARDVLRGVYGRFTEGFDAADLREAAALLNDAGARESSVAYGAAASPDAMSQRPPPPEPTVEELAALQALIDRSVRTATQAVSDSVAYPERQMTAVELVDFWRSTRLVAMSTGGGHGQPHVAPVDAELVGTTLRGAGYEDAVLARGCAA